MCGMVRIPINQNKLENLLEEQSKQKKERRKQRELSHIDESQLFEPAKRAIESDWLPEDGELIWFEEPSIFTREREDTEPASRVTERPDLICGWRPSGATISTLYIIELKKRLNKRGIGQMITYYWSARNGFKIVEGDKEYTITGNEHIVMFLGAIKYKKPYYNDLLNWLEDSLDMGSAAGIQLLPLEPE